MMDQNFRNQHSPFRPHEGLSFECWPPPIRIRQNSRGQQRELSLFNASNTIVPKPRSSFTIVAPKTPILMDHEPRFSVYLRGKFFGLRKGRRQRLLAEYCQVSFGGKSHKLDMIGAWRYRQRRVLIPTASDRPSKMSRRCQTLKRAAWHFRSKGRRSQSREHPRQGWPRQ